MSVTLSKVWMKLFSQKKIFTYKHNIHHLEVKTRGLAVCGLISQAEKVFSSVVCGGSFHPRIIIKDLCKQQRKFHQICTNT